MPVSAHSLALRWGRVFLVKSNVHLCLRRPSTARQAGREALAILLFIYIIKFIAFIVFIEVHFPMVFLRGNYGNFLFTEIGLKTLHCVIR